mmetsp:Transcript_19097/g.24117  ORF Transcript_19097/g.24117 Transcript_19097/m.24117 type:complete len:130 (+) Transcript_19097:162-551(+)
MLVLVSSEISCEYYMKENICRYAAAMRSLRHTNICHMVGACVDPLSLVTEYAALGSIADIIRLSSQKLTWARIKSIITEAARGMEYLHTRSPPLIHGSLSSANILVDDYWGVKISGLCSHWASKETHKW